MKPLLRLHKNFSRVIMKNLFIPEKIERLKSGNRNYPYIEKSGSMYYIVGYFCYPTLS